MSTRRTSSCRRSARGGTAPCGWWRTARRRDVRVQEDRQVRARVRVGPRRGAARGGGDAHAGGAARRRVVRLQEVLEDNEAVYLIMEHCEGGELFDKIVGDGRLHPLEAAHLFRQLASAVQFCHAQGVLHRDLKPKTSCSREDSSCSSRK
ncbi:hypothetical protein CLOM_g381 [Closterium sp. NIES-68]|nr:hypothetical protein CLOM_g10794 [Closterium sp. NIES-68]GJP40727.1 hypothetical protein CLOM_g381 [Closterium sp. NIES-68]